MLVMCPHGPRQGQEHLSDLSITFTFPDSLNVGENRSLAKGISGNGNQTQDDPDLSR